MLSEPREGKKLLVLDIDYTLFGKITVLEYISHKTSKYWGINIWANSADIDQTDLKEQSDLGLHCLPLICKS